MPGTAYLLWKQVYERGPKKPRQLKAASSRKKPSPEITESGLPYPDLDDIKMAYDKRAQLYFFDCSPKGSLYNQKA